MKLISCLSVCFWLLVSSRVHGQEIPIWQPNTSYAVGDLVGFNQAAFRCQQAHTSQDNWEPPVVPALWQPVPLPTGGVNNCHFFPFWNSITSYAAGSEVFSQAESGFFRALVANQAVEPGTAPNVWSPTFPECPPPLPPPPVLPWTSNTAYAVGQKVSFHEVEFTCVQAHTSEDNWEPPNVPALWQPTIPTPTGLHVIDATSRWVLMGWNPVPVISNPPLPPFGYSFTIFAADISNFLSTISTNDVTSSNLLMLIGDHPATQLTISIAAVDGNSLFRLQSPDSAAVFVHTPAASQCSGPPSAPLQLTVTQTQIDNVSLKWSAPTDKGLGMCTLKGYQVNHDFSVSNTVGADTAVQFGGLAPSSTHFFSVAAYNEFGPSASSNFVLFTLADSAK